MQWEKSASILRLASTCPKLNFKLASSASGPCPIAFFPICWTPFNLAYPSSAILAQPHQPLYRFQNPGLSPTYMSDDPFEQNYNLPGAVLSPPAEPRCNRDANRVGPNCSDRPLTLTLFLNFREFSLTLKYRCPIC